MSKLYRIPDYKKLYPDASEEVIAVLKTTERKMQYQEYDLKREQTIVSQKDHTVTAIPSREDSYERLLEQQMQFREDTESVEEIVLRRLQYVQLHKAISRLSADEQKLIQKQGTAYKAADGNCKNPDGGQHLFAGGSDTGHPSRQKKD